MKVTQSCPTLCDPMDCSLPGSSVHGDSPDNKTEVSYHSHLQGIFPTQGSNPGLQHCRQILYQLRHKGSPRILEWVAYPFSSGSSQPRNRSAVSCIAGGFFIKLSGKPSIYTNIVIFPFTAAEINIQNSFLCQPCLE